MLPNSNDLWCKIPPVIFITWFSQSVLSFGVVIILYRYLLFIYIRRPPFEQLDLLCVIHV